MSGSRPWWRRRRGEPVDDDPGATCPRVDSAPPVHATGREPPLRLLLFASGPAAGWGAQQHGNGLGGSIAGALARRTGRATTLEFLMDEQWADRDPTQALRAQHLSDYDAIVTVSAYRPAMLEAQDWRQRVDELRDTLLIEAGPSGIILVLSLAWADAVERAPRQWGGAFGSTVAGLVAATADSVQEFQQITYLTLPPPDDAAEWIGPAFSRPTYAAWGEKAAAALAPRLPDSPVPIVVTRS